MIRPTSITAAKYLWFAKKCLTEGGSGIKAISDGLLSIICKYTSDDAILIAVGGGDFLCHPRTGNLLMAQYFDNEMNVYYLPSIDNGGVGPSPIYNRYPYPLDDNDNGTFTVVVDGGGVTQTGAQLYGNLWWTDGKKTVLSWTGPPSVQFPIDREYNLPGFSQPAGSNIFTLLTNNIYQYGAVLCNSPVGTLVVGACYFGGLLVCITRTEGPINTFTLNVWKSKDTGKTWVKLGSFPLTDTAETTAFIAKDGGSFVYCDTLYALAPDVSAVTEGSKTPQVTKGARTITGTGGYDSNYKFQGGVNCFGGMDAVGALAFDAVTQTASFTEQGDSTSSATPVLVNVPVYTGNPATSIAVQQVEGPNACTNPDPSEAAEVVYMNFLATPGPGNYCSITWEGVDCIKGGFATKILKPSCYTVKFTVTATMQPQGISDTFTYTPPGSPAPITISGPVDDGAGGGISSGWYTASGGTPGIGGYKWTNSQGTITAGGYATFTGCGTATIAVTDGSQCRSAGLAVRLISGVWINDPTFTMQGTGGACAPGYARSEIDGMVKYMGCYNTFTDYTCAACHNDPGISAGVSQATCTNEGTDGGGDCDRWQNVQSRATWGCPSP